MPFRSLLRFLGGRMLIVSIFCGGFVSVDFGQSWAVETRAEGLVLTYIVENGKTSDTTISPNVWLYVPTGQSPTPFLSTGRFTAVWNGFVSTELRGDYLFQAELNGSLKLEINGQPVLDVSGTGALSEASKSIRLSKGTNALVATFTSPAQGDAFVRLQWQPKDSFLQPIPISSLGYVATTELQKAEKLRLGRGLFAEHRCINCHQAGKMQNAIPELGMDAPGFEEIGSRRNVEWLAKWIADPKSLRPTAHMPKLLRGEKAAQDAADVAGFLASLNSAKTAGVEKNSESEVVELGQKLFETFHCAACHQNPESSEMDATKIGLKQVAVKFASGMLTEFLKKPDAHFAWIKMPQFKLSDEQRESLSAYLISKSDKPGLTENKPDSTNIEHGKALVQTSGCLNCHTLKLENKYSAKALAEIVDWKRGCLAEKSDESVKSPDFQLLAIDREALQLFAATDRLSLSRHVPVEFAERQSRQLNCLNCHGQFEGFPRFDILGGKLKPEWSAKFIGGEITDKPRPWLDSQMPAFAKRAKWLAEGLAMQHGYPPQTPAEPAIDQDAAQIGQKIASVSPGFSCISCHSIGDVGATQVFEAPGINLALSGERLQPAYFKGWLRNPPSIDSQTKMPVYFDDEGKSPLTDFYEGSGEKQINAVWQYIRLGKKMPAPKTQ